ncbi:MAG TPA: lipid-A-disaccharide synthase [Pseudomonas sabulinigri]|uniref:lipid-A-disaccharide synthase n=1 Tax=marine sediment metagenome TaxID=412755 RepID=A0A0F9Y069_9ZZZZ|nr:lipid-A-disaccharide synthase [Halopseudomonas sabulinigri]HEC51005.1 lipid-A-disaccharide synthase [Halopseudomonas sabulinigri]|tara:strand:+ start:79408 stop:80577 length:1170 start_codon:yes stop_codon:yes gene_type:complete
MLHSDKPLCIALVAGEASGDTLGAGLIKALKLRFPQARFIGIGGPRMLAEGMQSQVPMERLSVMGLVEVLGRLRELLRIRRELVSYLKGECPDVFIGIDAPDFTLNVEQQLRDAGIATVHYVSPSVWAWREKRVLGIQKSTDLMLTLFPFEEDVYRRHGVSVRCVGHTLADQIPLQPDRQAARDVLGLPGNKRIVALLPGSRNGELRKLGLLFLQTAAWCLQREPELLFIMPCASVERRLQMDAILAESGLELPLTLFDGQAHEVLAASDAVLIASGTATLEAMLFKRPMVVAYRMAGLTFKILKRLVKVGFVSLPNLLAGREVAPEFLQDAATPEAMGAALLERLLPTQEREATQEVFIELHHSLRRDADQAAADAIADLLQSRGLLI